MKYETYKAIMSCLDTIETELNKVAEAVGHVSFSEFMTNEIACDEELKQAA
ncbi:hypothetical protein [Aliivibrio fischeri]|uniref:hypothetical protein n=1 Tax=Aliivibrio fischeri TaxID=668 RepID=UPI001A25DEB4